MVNRFDDLGRTVARGSLIFAYGPDGQVSTAHDASSAWSFVYDEDGNRRLKSAGASPVAAYVDEGFVDASGLTEPVSIGGRPAAVVRNGVFQSLATDLRGSVLAEWGQSSPDGVTYSRIQR